MGNKNGNSRGGCKIKIIFILQPLLEGLAEIILRKSAENGICRAENTLLIPGEIDGT